MERIKSSWLWVIIIIIIIVSLSFAPLFTFASVGRQTVYVVNCDGQPISNMSVVREWQSLLYENAPHSRIVLSDENGIAEFPAEAVRLYSWQIALGFLLKILSFTNPHADNGLYNAYIAGGRSVYPAANEPQVQILVCRR